MHRRVDELLSVFIVFRTPCLAEELLRNYLERLLVNVEAFAFSTAPPPDQEGKGGPSKELIHAQAIHAENQPLLVRHGEGDAAYTYVIWKVEVFIGKKNGCTINVCSKTDLDKHDHTADSTSPQSTSNPLLHSNPQRCQKRTPSRMTISQAMCPPHLICSNHSRAIPLFMVCIHVYQQ